MEDCDEMAYGRMKQDGAQTTERLSQYATRRSGTMTLEKSLLARKALAKRL